MQYELRCTVHNFEFGHNKLPDGYEGSQCPLCLHDDLKRYSALAKERGRQLESVLAAIDIKRTIEVMKS